MVPSFAPAAMPETAAGVVVTTGGQLIAHWPLHLLAVAGSPVNAYRVATTWVKPPVTGQDGLAARDL